MVALSRVTLQVPRGDPQVERARRSRLLTAINTIASVLANPPADTTVFVHRHSLIVSCARGASDIFGSKPIAEILDRGRTRPFEIPQGMSYEQVKDLLQDLLGLSR